MKIALIELNHMTLGIHTNTVPLGIGVIAKYLKLQMGDSVDVRMFKDAEKFLKATETWTPDVLGLGQYAWNSELNLSMARRLKKRNPSLVVVAGGPNLELHTAERFQYLKEHSIVDICVCFDGEIPVATIIQRLMKGETIQSLKKAPGAGTYAIDPDTAQLAESHEPPPRIPSLDVLGAMYADGFFDEFLQDGYRPFLQTQRGCPFLCGYCHSGNLYHNKILFQSAENFRKDMDYLGNRFRGNHNVMLSMANANFSLFKEDFDIADAIRETQEKYDWPKIIEVNSGKDPKKLMAIVGRFKYKFVPAIALQTTTPKVLKNVGRINIPFESFMNFQKEVGSTFNINPATELILSLPEETKESFLEVVRQVLNSGVQNIVIYTLMSLKGTALDTKESAQKHGHVFRYRLVPRCFSEIEGEKIFETEKVVIGTNSMPYEDYRKLRGLALIITAFAGSIEFMPFRRTLLSQKVDLAHWVGEIQRGLTAHPRLSVIYEQFLSDTETELYESAEAVKSFFSQPDHFQALKEGKFGDNLLRKYKTLFLSNHFKDCLDIAYDVSVHVCKKAGATLPSELLSDLKKYLSFRDISGMFKNDYDAKQKTQVTFLYDIPRWLMHISEDPDVEHFKGRFTYNVTVTDYIQRRLQDYRLSNRDPQLALQVLYRDGKTQDFWPVFEPCVYNQCENVKVV